MKMNFRLRALSFAILVSAPASAGAEIIGYDSFRYPDGPSLAGADSGAFWDFRNAATSRHSTRASAWAMAPGFSGGSVLVNSGVLFTSNYGVVRTYGGPDIAGENAGAVNNDTEAKKVYYRVTMTRGIGTSWCGVSSFDFGTERLFFGLFPDGTNQFSIYDQNTFTLMDRSPLPCTTGTTYTLVAKVDYAADRVSLFVNPDFDAAEPTVKTTFFVPTSLAATAVYTGTNWSTALRIASDGLTSWDDLTVATTWESLRTHEVTNVKDSGAGSLRQAVADASVSGARVTFSPYFGSLYAVADVNRLIRFHPQTPDTVDLDVPVTGLLAGERVVGLDFRIPLTDYTPENLGDLYALTVRTDETTDECRIYRLNPHTGAATLASASPAFTAETPYNQRYGFDYHPTDDHFRIVNWSDESIRFYPDTGAVTRDTRLTLPPSPGRLNMEAITGIAYSAEGNALYGLDDGNLLVQIGRGEFASQNAGAGRKIGSLGDRGDFTVSDGGFDISTEGVNGNESAWMTAFHGEDSSYYLHTVDLASGRSESLGRIGNTALVLRALAAAPVKIILKEERQIALATPHGVILDGPATKGRVCLTNFYRGSSTGRVFDVAAGSSLSLQRLTFDIAASVEGGALRSSGSLSLDQCTFHRCNATNGGALSAPGGLVKISRCTFSDCRANNTSGAVDIGAATAVISRSTFSGNRTNLTNPSFHGGGAIANAAGTLTLTGCIIAGNTAGSGVGPDIWNSSVMSADSCVVGDTGASGITATAGNRNLTGTAAAPLAPRIAPLGDYGSTTFTMPPLPFSPALNRILSTVPATDQRGFASVTQPDAGAAEYQGRADLARFWNEDWDGDGNRYGVEQAVGTDPFRADRDSILNLRIQPGSRPGDLAVMTFGFNPDVAPWTRWALREDHTLNGSAAPAWTPGWTYDGTTGTETTGLGNESSYNNATRIQTVIHHRGEIGHLFFRLEAELAP